MLQGLILMIFYVASRPSITGIWISIIINLKPLLPQRQGLSNSSLYFCTAINPFCASTILTFGLIHYRTCITAVMLNSTSSAISTLGSQHGCIMSSSCGRFYDSAGSMRGTLETRSMATLTPWSSESESSSSCLRG